MPADEAILVYCTCPDAAGAERLGRDLVEARLCACANVLPGMRSVYRWQGAVETADEAVLLLKTLRGRLPELTAGLRARHPYQEPCIVAVPIIGGSASYLAWIAGCVGP